MRGIAAGLVLVLAGVVVADSKREAKLVEYTSADGRFKVQFPDDRPKPVSKDLAAAGTVVRMTTIQAEAGRNLVVSVTFADYPDRFKDLAVKTVLDGVRDGIKGVDGDLKVDTDVKLDGDETVTGREIRVEAGKRDVNVVRCRAFLVGNRLYQVMATGPKDDPGWTTADRVLKSFAVLP